MIIKIDIIQSILKFIWPVHVHLKTDKLNYLQWPMKNHFFNVSDLENILVALTREIGEGHCFLYIYFFWIGVADFQITPVSS